MLFFARRPTFSGREIQDQEIIFIAAPHHPNISLGIERESDDRSVGHRKVVSGQWSVVNGQEIIATDHRPPITDHTQTCFRAASKSAIMSSTSSTPTEIRTRPSVMP